MSIFPLKEATITYEGTPIRLRELTQGDRSTFSAAVKADPLRGPAVMASLACVDPILTEEEATAEPAGVIDAIVEKALELSGMRKAGDAPTVEPDAG